MQAHSSVKSVGSSFLSTLLALAALGLNSGHLQAQSVVSQSDAATNQGSSTSTPQQQQPPATDPNKNPRGSGKGNNTGSRPTTVPTTRNPSSKGGHAADTRSGSSPHSSNSGSTIATASIAAAAGFGVFELIKHHNESPKKLGHDGPSVPEAFNMSGFSIKGLVHPGWPIVLDFTLDSPGAVQVDITSADKHHYQVTMSNTPNRRAYAIFRLPANFGDKLQTAIYHVHAVPLAGTTTSTPGLRTYGMGAGEKAVGSVAIDQLTFQPAAIHPQAKEVANYGFHTHSAFDSVNAEFIFTTLYNGSLLVQKDQEQKLSPIPEGERATGTWEGKGKPGEHMLQIRAWRGADNGGDWVVAWSPDIVDVVK